MVRNAGCPVNYMIKILIKTGQNPDFQGTVASLEKGIIKYKYLFKKLSFLKKIIYWHFEASQ